MGSLRRLALCYLDPPNGGVTHFLPALSLNGTLLDRLILGFALPANIRVTATNQPAATGYGYMIAATPSLTDSEVMRFDLATGRVTAVKPLGQRVFALALLSTPPEPALLSGPTLRNVTEAPAN